ncbi:MAG: hypothetical protein ACOCSL_05650, partial [Thermoplasmatota archaeon]
MALLNITDSIKKKLLITIGITAIIVLSSMTYLTVSQTTDQFTTETDKRMTNKALSLSNEFNSRMAKDQQLADTLTSMMEKYNKNNASRSEVNEMLKNTAEQNSDVSGVYVAYEPDAFDGKTTYYKNKSDEYKHANPNGRFAPYWNRFGGSLNEYALGDYNPLSTYS